MDEIYRKTENVVTRCIAGQTILVPVKAHVAELDSIFMLNEVGTSIWGLIDRGMTIPGLIEAVREEYDVEAHEASVSVLEFVNSLFAARLIAPESRAINETAEL